MILQTILEGIGLGVLLILVCAIGIRKGAVGMVHLYSPEVKGRCVKLGLRLCLHELSGIMALSQRRGCHHGEITASA